MLIELENDLFDSGEELTIYTQDGEKYIIHVLTLIKISDTVLKFYDYNNVAEIICLNPTTIIKYTYTDNEA